MARPHRIVEPGSIHHVGSRGAVRQQLFRDDQDWLCFLSEFDRVAERFGWSCLSYCLMGNHYHLLIELRGANLSEGMQHLNGKYARAFNERHSRDGCVFGTRFWSQSITTDRYLHATVRYINLNPVDAQFCLAPAQWPWSSHRELVGEVPGRRVAVGRTLSLLGAGDGFGNRPYLDLIAIPSRDPLVDLAVSLPYFSPAERAAQLERLRSECGYSTREIAGALDCSIRTARRWMQHP